MVEPLRIARKLVAIGALMRTVSRWAGDAPISLAAKVVNWASFGS